MNEFEIILETVQEAGRNILSFTKNPFLIKEKANKDMVTDADILANNILRDRLEKIYPDAYWLSEENQDLTKNQSAQYIWIVDPIDGTREYIEGIPEYAISIALIKNNMPIFASIFNPATQELFYAIKDKGAYLNNQRIYCRESTKDSFLLLVSRSEYKRGEWSSFPDFCEIKAVGSIAYKMALVAAGLADATITRQPRNIWDVAAGALLIAESKGKVTTWNKQNINFNNHETTIINGIIASSNYLWPIITKNFL